MATGDSADDLADRITRQVLAGLKPSTPAGISVGELATRYKAFKRANNPKWKATEYRLGPIVDHFGEKEAASVGLVEWDGYVMRRLSGALRPGRSISAITTNFELDLLRGMMNWAIDRGLMASNPLARAKLIKVKSKGQSPLREQDLDALLLAAPNKVMEAYVIVGLDTGLRRNENLFLRWPDLDFERGVIHVRNGKGGKEGWVTCTRRGMAALDRLPRVVRRGYVYANPDTGKPYDSATINKWIRQMVEESGIEASYDGKIRIHALRHGHGTNSVERGIDVKSVQEQLRHSSLAITEKYIHSRMDQRIAEREKFEAGIALVALASQTRKAPKRSPRSKPEHKKEPVDEKRELSSRQGKSSRFDAIG